MLQVVDVYRVGLHRPVDQETETDEKTGRGDGDYSEDIAEITAALMHVIDYRDAECRRQVHGTV